MTTWLPSSKWTRKGPVNVSAKIRQRKSKKVKVAKKGELPSTVTRKLHPRGERIS